jgi:hypothetical protein
MRKYATIEKIALAAPKPIERPKLSCDGFGGVDVWFDVLPDCESVVL